MPFELLSDYTDARIEFIVKAILEEDLQAYDARIQLARIWIMHQVDKLNSINFEE